MKITLNVDWILHKVRIIFLLTVFWAIYTYVGEVWSFIWIGYFILNDLMEIVVEMEKSNENRAKAWEGITTKRKGF